MNAAPRLAGKVALITGAGAGIGKASALLFAREGAAVAICEISDVEGTKVAEEIKAAGGKAIFIPTDVTQAASAEACIRRTVETFGRLDILYNNAGGSSASDGKIADISPEIFNRVMSFNLNSAWTLCHFGIPAMIRSGGGAIINTSSALGVNMQEGARHAYSAAKGAVLSLTRAIAFDYRGQGIRANVIVPGFTASERVANDLAAQPALAEHIGAQHPLGFGKPQNVAQLALYLGSDESQYTTGQVFVVNNEIIG
jgi:NAD(P)-dependent dehydrogenase (short-subunit alcohol dehydrogenase family)